jgi:hypothetical protein
MLSTVHREGVYPYVESDRCMCATCSCEGKVRTTIHPENIRGLSLLHYTLLAMLDVSSLCVAAELFDVSTNGSPVAHPTVTSNTPTTAQISFVARGLYILLQFPPRYA